MILRITNLRMFPNLCGLFVQIPDLDDDLEEDKEEIMKYVIVMLCCICVELQVSYRIFFVVFFWGGGGARHKV